MHKYILSIVAFTSILLFNPSVAQSFPTRPIKLVVPFAPGGPADIAARLMAEQLGKRMRQPVVVENRVGAGGSVGTEAVAVSAPDGYTIGIASVSTHVVNPSCNSKLRYDPIKSFTPLSLVADMPFVIVGRTGLAADFRAFERALRSKPAPTFGTPGNCSLGHVMLEHLNQALSGELLHVPYKGSAPAATDLLGGSLDFMGDTVAVLGPHIEAGKMTPLAVVWPKRVTTLKDVPTFAELGYGSVNLTAWYGVVAPAGLPAAIVGQFEVAIAQSLADPDLQAKFDKAGIAPVRGVGSREFKTFLEQRYRSEATFIRSRKMSAE